MFIILIPNVLYALKNKNKVNMYQNKKAVIAEQIGRYGCFALMIFNIPFAWRGFWFSFGELVYIVVNSVLLLAYCVSWVILWKKSNIVKALLLSIIPSVIFIFSSVLIVSIPLLAFSIIFAVAHILISVKNVQTQESVER